MLLQRNLRVLFLQITSTTPSSTISFAIKFVLENDLVIVRLNISSKLAISEDAIPTFLVRDCRSVLAKLLAMIVNLFLHSGIFQDGKELGLHGLYSLEGIHTIPCFTPAWSRSTTINLSRFK